MALYDQSGKFLGVTPAKPSGGLYNTGGQLQTAQPTPAPQPSPSVGGFLKNAVSSVGNLISGVGTAVLHPLDTLNNVSKVGAGAVESGLGALGAKDITGAPLSQQQTPEKQSFNNLVGYFGQRYGGSNVQQIGQNIAKTAYNDPAGFLLDLSSLLDAGSSVVGKVGEVSKLGVLSTAAETAGKVGDAINPITNIEKGAAIAGKGAATIGGKLGGEALGVTTGAGFGAVKEAFTNGGEAFTKAMRGDTSADQVVQSAKDALGAAKQARRADYQNNLQQIEDNYRQTSLTSQKGTTVMQNNMTKNNPLATGGITHTPGATFNLSTQGLKSKLTQTLQNFGVDVSKNRTTLDFTNSPLPHAEEKVLKQMATDINKWSDITPTGLNKLGTKLGNYSNMTNSPTLNAIATALKQNIRGYVGERIPEVNKLNATYAAQSSFIKQAQTALSLGDKASVDTAFNKLTSTLRGNNEFRTKMLSQLQQFGGADIKATIAGTALSGAVPRGIVGKTLEALSGSAGVFLHDPTFIVGLAAATPRIVGEFVRALGITTKTLHNWSDALQSMGAGEAANNLLKSGYYINKSITQNQAPQATR